MISCIAELPPLVRYSYVNMISHFIISNASPNNNSFLENNMKALELVLKDGLQIDGIFLIKIIGTISDSPARA